MDIMQHIQLMEDTVNQPALSSEGKQQIINQLQSQVATLKSFIKTGELHEQKVNNSDETGKYASVEPTIAPTLQRTPEEDHLSHWVICACDKQDCFTCQAEREADVAGNLWFSQDVDGMILAWESSSEDSGSSYQEEKEAYPMTNVYCVVCREHHDYSELQEVFCKYDEQYWTTGLTSKLIIQLNPSLSLTGKPQACGLVTMQFIHRMKTEKARPLVSFGKSKWYLHRNIYDALRESVKEGNRLYKSNYKSKAKNLSAEEIVSIHQHMGIKIKGKVEVDCMVNDLVISHIMNLRVLETMLMMTQDKYNVWSIIVPDQSRIVVFDCQTTMCSGILRGGMIYRVFRTTEKLAELLSDIANYSGVLNMKCQLVLLQ